jgi:thioesterase domain-containing protein/aryl carrier-like protein
MVGGLESPSCPTTKQRIILATMTILPRDALELQLQRIWEELLDQRPISIDANFFELGGDSLTAMTLLARIVQETGYTVPASGIMQAPTIEQLAKLLRQQADARRWSPLVRLKSGESGRPLFLVHPLGGNVLCYLQLARRLRSARPVYAFQSRGIDGEQPPSERIEEMASDYIDALRQVQPQGPYLLGGWSLGGIIAYEMAQQIHRAGESVELLVFFDAGHLYAFAVMLTFFKKDTQDMWSRLASPEDDQIAFFREHTKEAQLIPQQADSEMARRIYRVVVANMRALFNYHSQPYPGKVTLFRAQEKYIETPHDPEQEWRRLAREVEVIPSPGNHLTLVHEPHVDTLAQRLDELLLRVAP